MNKIELEKRLIRFSIRVVELSEPCRKIYALRFLSEQLTRSAVSAALNYGEAQGAESKKDFIHKIGIVIKELRESKVNLNILDGLSYMNNKEEVKKLLMENDELIAIYYTTIRNTKSNISKP